MIKAQTLDEIPEYAKWLIYGPQGIGKTQWVAENVPDPIWYDFERSTDTLRSIGMTNIPVVSVGPSDNPDEVVKHIKEQVTKKNFRTIVFDTISSSQIFQLEKWMEKQNHDLPLFQDYRKSTNFFADLFFWLQHADIHVVLIAHERDQTETKLDVKGNPLQVRIGVVPDVTPALHKAVTQLVSGVFRLQKRAPKRPGEAPGRTMLCNSKGLYIAKNRYGIHVDEIDDPTWDSFMKTERNAL